MPTRVASEELSLLRIIGELHGSGVNIALSPVLNDYLSDSEDTSYYGLTVASPYVGMARFQDGGSNQCISVFTAISSPGNKY